MKLNEAILAELCLLAYDDPAELASTRFDEFYQFQGVQRGGAEAVVAEDHGTVVVVVRGTQLNWLDWLFDLMFLFPSAETVGRVHRGFRAAARKLEDEGLFNILHQHDPKMLWFAGHSLGGGTAALLAWAAIQHGFACPINLFTIGQPRTGDEDWTAHFQQAIYGLNGRIDRMVTPLDVVPHLPPAGQLILPRYRHAGPTRMLLGDDTLIPEATLPESMMATAWQAVFSPLKVWSAHKSKNYLQKLRNWVNHRTRNKLPLLIEWDTES